MRAHNNNSNNKKPSRTVNAFIQFRLSSLFSLKWYYNSSKILPFIPTKPMPYVVKVKSLVKEIADLNPILCIYLKNFTMFHSNP